MNQIKLNKFDPTILEKKRSTGNAPSCAIIGKRSTGKSVLVQDILYHFTELPMVLCMFGTEGHDNFYSKYINDNWIYPGYNSNVVSDLINIQKKILWDYFNNGQYSYDHPKIGIGILMDTIVYDTNMMSDPGIRDIFLYGRRLNITSIITFHYALRLSPQFRTNLDYVFVFRDDKQYNIKILYEYFFGCFDTFDDFKKVFYEYTNDYGCLVLDNTARSTKIEDQVFWYKATPDRQFKIGSVEMWKIWDSQLKDRCELYNNQIINIFNSIVGEYCDDKILKIPKSIEYLMVKKRAIISPYLVSQIKKYLLINKILNEQLILDLDVVSVVVLFY